MVKSFTGGASVIIVLYATLASVLAVKADYQPAQYQSLIWAGIIAAVNTTAAFLSVILTIKKDQVVFNRVLFAGVSVRLLIMLVVLFMIIRFTRLDQFVFIVAFFILYFLLQGWEMIVINKHVTNRPGA
jgi:hypothetical protein